MNLMSESAEKTGVLVIFVLDQQKYALRLEAVERVIPAVEVTPLPKAPEIVEGVINLGGRIVPVLNIRRRFRHSEREMETGDHLIIARTSKRTVALIVDEALGAAEYPEAAITGKAEVLNQAGYVKGVVKISDGLVFIHDLDTFLSLDEAATLDNALGGSEQ
jgi:purine-binding chemotaxis protein CheW